MPSDSDPAGIHARQVPQSIRFLRSLGIPATQLAGIFGESADYIRHIDSRAYKATKPTSLPAFPEWDDLALLRLTDEERRKQVRRNLQGIRLRTKQDLDQAEQAVWAIYRSHQSVGFEEGYEALLSLRPTVANARHGQALRVLLLIEEKLAWFALPLGRIEMALDHAERAMDRAVEAFKESAGAKDYLLRYGEAALVASVCLQKLHQPELSLSFIQAADEANIAIGDLPGSEHLRQRGASLIQLGKDYDDLADGQLRRAPKRMLRKNEARNEVDLGMSGLRQRAFLHPSSGFDRVLELTEEAATAYGRTSLQYAVAAKSAALAGLRYATPESTETALDLLAETSSAPDSPIPHILSITPDLKLSAEQLDLWLRFAMSETPLPPRK
jgi:hypothetical protein